MYGGNDDGGASQYAGGGFMPSPGGGAPGGYKAGGGTAAGSFPGGAGSLNTGLLPILVTQIVQAETTEEGSITIDGQAVNNVTLVGRLGKKELRSTDLSFTLNDGYGSIFVKKWIESDDPEEVNKLESIQENTYVRIYGHLRDMNGSKSLQAFAIRPITEFDEVTNHMLECILAHKKHTKGQSRPAAAPAASHMSSGSAPVAPSASNEYAAPPPTAAGGEQFNSLQQRVMAIYDDPHTASMESGMSVTDVASRMVGYTQAQVRETITFLMNEGLLYSTIDDEHYKSAAA